MPKTKDAFAMRDFDGKRILQRPYFRAWHEKFHVRTDVTDDAAIHSDSYMLDFIDGDDETQKLAKAEKYNRQLKELHNRLVKFQKLIMRHTEGRLEPYRRAVKEKMDSDDADTLFLQSKVDREQGLMTSYIFDVLASIGDLLIIVQKRWQASEQELQATYRRRFGERLKAAREAAGLSRKELGDAINISPAGYAYYERGQRDVTPTSLIRIARTLNISADWLIGLK